MNNLLDDNERKNKDNPLRDAAINIIRQNEKQTKVNLTDVENIVIDNKDTNIPINLPTAIIGDKGSGKTTLIKALIELSEKYNIFNNIYFIYSSLTMPTIISKNVVKIDVNDCEEFLSMLFETKSIFNSYYQFFKSINFNKLQDKYANETLIDNDINELLDNNIVKYNKTIINSHINARDKVEHIFNIGEKILTTFSKPFNIGTVKINGLKYNDRDCVIIDDIAIASKFLFNTLKTNTFYDYMTLTRHLHLCIVLSGQQIEQLPKTLRREIMCWILSKNTNLELLNGVLTKTAIKKIITEQDKLDKYEFVIYNLYNGNISIC